MGTIVGCAATPFTATISFWCRRITSTPSTGDSHRHSTNAAVDAVWWKIPLAVGTAMTSGGRLIIFSASHWIFWPMMAVSSPRIKGFPRSVSVADVDWNAGKIRARKTFQLFPFRFFCAVCLFCACCMDFLIRFTIVASTWRRCVLGFAEVCSVCCDFITLHREANQSINQSINRSPDHCLIIPSGSINQAINRLIMPTSHEARSQIETFQLRLCSRLTIRFSGITSDWMLFRWRRWCWRWNTARD